MTLSGKQIQKLGARLRDGDPDEEDRLLLDTFRREFDARLLSLSASITTILRDEQIRYVLAGRAKRTKSIIRKLRRPANKNMDLSRMDDIVGLRIIVADPGTQARAVDSIRAELSEVRQPFDYRAEPAGTYRAVHLVLGEAARRVEVQVRTCSQHLWADACERFGERAKEGDPLPQDKKYLDELGSYCLSIDNGAAPEADARFFGRLQVLTQGLQSAGAGEDVSHSYVVVYNIETDQLVRCELFAGTAEGRVEALEFYRYQSSNLNELEYDVLILNASSEGALRVTHPRYFPE